jgi:glycerophosphoryl diester phosphodiesterase
MMLHVILYATSAVQVGTQMLELDCHITQDGEVVVCHDEDLSRLTGEPKLVHETLYKVCRNRHARLQRSWLVCMSVNEEISPWRRDKHLLC